MYADVTLEQKEYGRVLTDGVLEVYGDYTKLKKRIKKNVIGSELIVKAVKIRGMHKLRILDATAGLGEDSFLLAAAGHEVLLCEYNKVIFSLLQDAVSRAKQSDDICEIAGRMKCICADSISICERIRLKEPVYESQIFEPDVVFLDPMFPEKTKNSLTNKKLQLFQKLEAPCTTEQDLLSSAFQINAKKVVVKRPLKGDYLAGKKPGYSIEGKTIRYDCYVL